MTENTTQIEALQIENAALKAENTVLRELNGTDRVQELNREISRLEEQIAIYEMILRMDETASE